MLEPSTTTTLEAFSLLGLMRVPHRRVRRRGRSGSSSMIKAVLWDFGGVILSSPFDAFRHYEAARGLPPDFIRTVNATGPHANAWARLERSEITAREFDAEFARESAALGHEVRGADLLELLAGDI